MNILKYVCVLLFRILIIVLHSDKKLKKKIFCCVLKCLMFREHREVFPQSEALSWRYLQPCSDAVKRWLRNIKNSSKILLLVTRSHSCASTHSGEFYSLHKYTMHRKKMNNKILKWEKKWCFIKSRLPEIVKNIKLSNL